MSRTNEYFEQLEKNIKEVYGVAEDARSKGYDPVNKVEVPLAHNLAEKVVGLISTIYPQLTGSGVVERILELEKEYGKLDPAVCLVIAEEISKEKFCKFENQLQAIDCGSRAGFAYITLSVVSSPIEGLTEIKVKKTRDGKEYFAPYYSGPVRSAGGTGAAFSLVIIDYLRELFGYAKYDPTDEEVKRSVIEMTDYHERITNLQYMPTEEEIILLAKNIPLQISGDPSEKIEVSNYKDLSRVETNFIRSGFCLTFAEGLAQKAAKIKRYITKLREKGFKLSDWDFLDDYIELHKKRDAGKTDSSPTYIKDMVAGRPIFGHPSRSGAFRFRYGRSRVAGFSAASLHPATMAISDNFIAVGTQLKIEKPTKGCAISCCDSIDGPIVKFKDGSVKQINDFNEAKEAYKDVVEILYYGDLLFPFSDLANRNYDLIKPGYVEEWWNLELEKLGGKVDDYMHVNFGTALELSRKYQLPLYPKFIYFWTQINKEQLLELLRWVSYARINQGKLMLPYTHIEKEKFSGAKRALELLGAAHKVSVENVIVSENNSRALLVNIGLELDLLSKENCFIEKEVSSLAEKIVNHTSNDVLEIINCYSKFIIKDKAGDFIGTRMGRPEKAKLRKLTGNPHGLFPVGEEGGRFRSINEACNAGKVRSDFPIRFCKDCNNQTIYNVCENCGGNTFKKYFCRKCGEIKNKKICDKKTDSGEEHGNCLSFMSRDLDINNYFKSAVRKLGLASHEIPALIKGVRGTFSGEHDMEHLSKAILRAKYCLNVNKDGTVRYDMTELPITHFKPKEIGTSIEKLKEMGYQIAVDGKELVEDNQILELMPHDVILPSNAESGDEKAEDVFINIANFIDALLVRLYGLKSFYNIKKKEDILGHLSVCMAPHNCAGVISRIIGFSKTQGLVASPYMHAAMRRDCFDYDTYISIKNNGIWENVKIGDFVENLNPRIVVDNFGTYEKKVTNIKTIGFDSCIQEVGVNNFTKHIERDLFEIKTSLGKRIRVTENHKFLVNNKVKRTIDLKVGDKLPLPIKINISENNLEVINLVKELRNEDLMVRGIREIINKINKIELENILDYLKISKKQFQNFKLRDSYPIKLVLNLNEKSRDKIYDIGMLAAKRDNVSVPIKIKLTCELLEVIGLYIAEGYSRSVCGKKGLNQVYISSIDKNIREFIKRIIKSSFGLKFSENKEDRVTYSSKIFYLFFNKILKCGSTACEKRIPSLFLDLPISKLACLLRGYFEGDGNAEKKRKKISCDTISNGLLYDLEFCLARFNIFAKRYEYEKESGKRLKDFYLSKNKAVPKFKITKLIIGSDFVDKFYKIGFLSERKNNILKNYEKMNSYGKRIDYDSNFVYDPIVAIDFIGKKKSYCLNVSNKNHLVAANFIISRQCDGDEAAAMLLLDVLINFSRKYLPSHRGGTQDAPLVLNGHILAGEVDDQILDFEVINCYPLELYEKAEKRMHSSEINIETVKTRIVNNLDTFINIGYTHETDDFNNGVLCSSYKKIPTMPEKVDKEMELVTKSRCVDTADVARLIIERHFIRDIRGNLRKFSMQGFRCVKCNEKFRRPPLSGKCSKCDGKIIFTISEGGIVKYLEPATKLAEKYDIPIYVKQNIEMTRKHIESIFGKEETRQTNLEQWF